MSADPGELSAMLVAAFRRTDALFSLLEPRELRDRPIPLRHPFLFYLGHLPAFAWNQIGRGVLGHGHLRADFDRLFERGIDPADEATARGAAISAWPPIDEILAYRDEARRAVLARVPEVLGRSDDELSRRGRIVHLVIEHELMHQETLLYMLQEQRARSPREGAPELAGGEGRAAEPRGIDAGEVTLGVDLDAIPFGWDNEIGRAVVEVPAFTLDSLPVRNADYLAFLETLGPAGREALTPRAWMNADGGLQVKSALGPVPFALASGWPAQVSGRQARAYCAARGGRLPTEAELRRAAFTGPGGDVRAHPWGNDGPEARHGNFGFRGWSPVPTGSHPDGASAWGVEEIIGNGWEWTATPFGPLPGFTAWARTYPGYSADFFDGEHDVVLGASWATDEKLLRPSFRNFYRRDYPFVFSSFRVARDG